MRCQESGSRRFTLLASIDVERAYKRSGTFLGLLRLRPERRAASARAYWASVVLRPFEAFAFAVVATGTFRPISRDIHLRGWIVGFAPAVCAATRCAPPQNSRHCRICFPKSMSLTSCPGSRALRCHRHTPRRRPVCPEVQSLVSCIPPSSRAERA